MSDNTIKVHWSFWVISIFMLIWNVMGCINFFVQMNPEMLSSYREAEQTIIQNRPLWATVAFAIAVFGSTVGCILLLLKNNTAFFLFLASLFGVVVTIMHSLTIGITYSLGETIGIIVMPIVVAIFLIWYFNFVKGKGWLSAA